MASDSFISTEKFCLASDNSMYVFFNKSLKNVGDTFEEFLDEEEDNDVCESLDFKGFSNQLGLE